MNWGRILMAGVAAGIVGSIADFVMHGVILGATYMRYSEVFTQEAANPGWFFLVSICIGLASAVLFAKTRSSWSGGLAGGATFGFFLGLVAFFTPFYSSLVIEGFPYYLSWCQGGVALITGVIMGAVLGALYRES